MEAKQYFLLATGLSLLTCAVADNVQNAPASSRGGVPATAPSVVTTQLESPAAGGAFEPAIAVDPSNPNRILVASMSGTPKTHHTDGGAWLWLTEDGGHTWRSRAMQPPPAAGEHPTFAADVSPAFAADGTPLVTVINGNLNPGDGGNGGIFVIRLGSDLSNLGPGVEIMHSMDSGPGSPSVANDKPWMIVDTGPESRFRGTAYAAASEFDLPAHDDAKPTTVYPKLKLAVSKDGAKTFLPARTIAESAFWPSFSISRDGTLDVVYTDLVWEAGDRQGRGRSQSSSAVRHLRSHDGGAAFEPATLVAKVSADIGMSMPSIVARENGDLLSCWAQAKGSERATHVHCALRSRGQDWGRAGQPAIQLDASTVAAYPTVVAAGDAWYLLLYLVGAHQTEVALFRSDGAKPFTRISTLKRAPGLGLGRLCLLSAACTSSKTEPFDIGDYVSMSAARERLAAVYVLPSETAKSTPAIVVSVVNLAK